MTREIYDKAEKIVSEINRIDVVKQHIDGEEDKPWSDTCFLANLLGKKEVIAFLNTRKRQLELEFEQL
jgi:predicted ATPase